MLRQHSLTEWVELDKGYGFAPDPIEGEIEASDAREEGEGFHPLSAYHGRRVDSAFRRIAGRAR